ncbi:hypothetical protein IQ07DRAFT_337665 [Pyrenochaeta sp. DS3sAY3a]|nr:hypothetical protein IQ07DRAFT_337665 [Pyrenochaeta sp. DS3sAY3a]
MVGGLQLYVHERLLILESCDQYWLTLLKSAFQLVVAIKSHAIQSYNCTSEFSCNSRALPYTIKYLHLRCLPDLTHPQKSTKIR